MPEPDVRTRVARRTLLASPDDAAQHLVRLAATTQDVAGRYLDRGRPGRPSPLVADERLARAVWDDANRRLSLREVAA